MQAKQEAWFQSYQFWVTFVLLTTVKGKTTKTKKTYGRNTK